MKLRATDGASLSECDMNAVKLKRIAELAHDDIVCLAFEMSYASPDQRVNRQFFDCVLVILRQRLGQAVLECGADDDTEIAIARMLYEGCPNG